LAQTIFANIRPTWKKFAIGKHASFFRSGVSNEEKSFIKLPLDRKKATKQIPGPKQ
jgi:hypothetical protein